LKEKTKKTVNPSLSRTEGNEGVVQVPLATRVSRPSSLQSPKRTSTLSSHPLTAYKGVHIQ